MLQDVPELKIQYAVKAIMEKETLDVPKYPEFSFLSCLDVSNFRVRGDSKSTAKE